MSLPNLVKPIKSTTVFERASAKTMKSPATVAQEKYANTKGISQSTVDILEKKDLQPEKIIAHARKSRELIRNRNKGFTTVQQCFSGGDLVDFVMEEYIIDSDHARKICFEIFDKKLIVGVSSNTFVDSKKELYRFAQKHHVLIVGGGYSGLHVANGIDLEYFDVTLVSKYEHFENISIIPNFIVHDKVEHYQSPYKTCLKEGVKFVKGEAVSITDKKIELLDGTEITSFDFMVLATGSFYDLSKLNVSDDGKTIPVINGISLDSLSKHKSQLDEAKKIAVIGTGPVGVEILGSLVHKYPEKEFHSIGCHEKFMFRAAPKAHEPILKFYKDKSNIKLHFGQTVKGVKGDIISTDKEEIQVDAALACTGFKPNSMAVKKGMPDCVNEDGYVIVNQSCQVEGFDNIFAIGDITSFKEEKLAISAEMHADVVLANITKVLTGQKLSTYTPSSKRPMMIYMAPKYTVFCFDRKVMASGYLPSMAKNFVIQKLIKDYKSE